MRSDLAYQTPYDWNLFLVGDVHKGSILHYRRGFAKFLNTVESSYVGTEYPQYGGLPASRNRIVWMGDQAECITIDDKRFNFDTTEQPLLRCLEDEIVRTIDPVKKISLFLLKGNHEDHVTNSYGDMAQFTADRLGIDYGSFSAIAKFISKQGLQFKLHATHGAGVIRSQAKDPEQAEANQKASLKKKLKDLAGDCVVQAMGHTHRLMIVNPIKQLYIKTEDGKLRQGYTSGNDWPQNAEYIHPDQRWYVNTGSFTRLYADPVEDEQGNKIYPTSYAERRGYGPTELGYAVCLIRDNKVVGIEKEIV